MNQQKVVIIGAGIGGLATAALLAKRGYDVSVYEKSAAAGGRMGQLCEKGFTFDTGPSWLLMVDAFEHYFKLIGVDDMYEFLELQRLDPAFKAFFAEDTSTATIHSDQRAIDSIKRLEPNAPIEKYVSDAAKMYDLAVDDPLYNNYDSIRSLWMPRALKHSPYLLKSLAESQDRYISNRFANPKVKKLLEYHMVFLGASPFAAPALFRMMNHLDFTQGVFYPRGGMYGIIEKMISMCEKSGVKFHFNSAVDEIIVAKKHATGIRLANKSIIAADIVISNADVFATETKLLRNVPGRRRNWKNKMSSPSAIMIFLGVKGELPQLEHHNLILADDWRQNFDSIFNDKTWPDPASMYICKTTATDKSVAPDGHENVFILVPIQSGDNFDANEVNKHAEKYLDDVATQIGESDLRKRIVYKKIYGPDYFATEFNSYESSMLGLAHSVDQSALFRPHSRSRAAKNVYYVGANTVPGIGVPMCLISAELIAKRLVGDKKPGRISQ